jgi:uncharacterized protein (DUF58 family)
LRKFSEALKFHSRIAPRPLHAKRRRRFFSFSFGITREGILYLIFVLLLSLVAASTSNNLIYAILAALLSIIVISGIISGHSLKQVSLSLQVPENVFVHEKVSIKVSMKNLKRLFPSISILVEDSEQHRQESLLMRLKSLLTRLHSKPAGNKISNRNMFRQAAYFPILRPGENKSELIIQSFPHRGLYNLQGFWISTRFPFGLFQRGEYMEAQGEVLVYPSIREASSFFRLLPLIPGKVESRHLGPGESLFSIREYQNGESARMIDWKASAKKDKLMAREFAQEEESKLCLILDTHLHLSAAHDNDERFERAVSITAGIAAHFIEEGAGLELLTPQDYVSRGVGLEQLYRILRSLAIVRAESADSLNIWDIRHFQDLPEKTEPPDLPRIFSDKIFKIILTSHSRGSFPSGIWRSSHVMFFDEL